MTVLTPLPEVSQRDGEWGDWDFCSWATVAIVSQARGLSVSVRDVTQYARARGWNPAAYGSTDQVIQAAAQWGTVGHVVSGDMRSAIDRALARRHVITVLIRSDGWGNPLGLDPRNTGRADHWVTVWGYEDNTYFVANSLGEDHIGEAGHWGHNHRYTAQLFERSLEGVGIEWDFVHGDLSRDTGGETLSPDEMTMLRRLTVRLSFRDAGYVEPTPEQQQWWVQRTDLPDLDLLAAAILDTANELWAEMLKEIGDGPRLQSEIDALSTRVAALESVPTGGTSSTPSGDATLGPRVDHIEAQLAHVKEAIQ